MITFFLMELGLLLLKVIADFSELLYVLIIFNLFLKCVLFSFSLVSCQTFATISQTLVITLFI